MAPIIIASAAFMAVLCLPSSEGTAYHIHIGDKVDEMNDCVRHVKVYGDGIRDSFQTTCTAEVDKYSLLNGVLVIGDQTKDRVSVFSDTPSRMVVFHGEKKRCLERTYTPTTKQTEIMSDGDCKKYKKEMASEWKGSKKIRAQQNRRQHFFKLKKGKKTSGTVDEDMFVITHLKKNKDRTGRTTCDGKMELGRSKLQYEEQYNDCHLRKIVFIPEGVIIGDYRTTDGFTLISDTPDSVVSVYPDKICSKMIFKKGEKGWVIQSASNMEEEDCEKYKKKTADWMNNTKDIKDDSEDDPEDEKADSSTEDAEDGNGDDNDKDEDSLDDLEP